MAGGYVDGMLAREQQTSTFLAMVLRFPWHNRHARSGAENRRRSFTRRALPGGGQVACVAIGIAASSDEHLGLLRQLTHVLSDDSVAEQLKSATTAEERAHC